MRTGRNRNSSRNAQPSSRKEKVARSVNDGNDLLHRHWKIDVNADWTSTGQAIEPSSTRVNILPCERKCHFPLMAGLHRSSNDSPGLTATLPFLVWCHVNKSNTPSSMRTCVAGAAYLLSPNHPPSMSTSHRRSLNQSRKFSKQLSQLKEVKIPAIALSSVKRLTSDFMKETVVFVMEGITFLLSTQSISKLMFAYSPYQRDIFWFMIRLILFGDYACSYDRLQPYPCSFVSHNINRYWLQMMVLWYVEQWILVLLHSLNPFYEVLASKYSGTRYQNTIVLVRKLVELNEVYSLDYTNSSAVFPVVTGIFYWTWCNALNMHLICTFPQTWLGISLLLKNMFHS